MLGHGIKNSFWILKQLVNTHVLVVSTRSHFNAFSDVAHFLSNTRASFNHEIKPLRLKSVMELLTIVATARLFCFFYKLLLSSDPKGLFLQMCISSASQRMASVVLPVLLKPGKAWHRGSVCSKNQKGYWPQPSITWKKKKKSSSWMWKKDRFIRRAHSLGTTLRWAALPRKSRVPQLLNNLQMLSQQLLPQSSGAPACV